MDTLENLYKWAGSPVDLDDFESTFNKTGSDKSTRHNYHEVYSALFGDRDVVKSILEIGIYHGGSLRSWKELFKKSHILGLDYERSFFIEEDRIKSLYVDQRDLRTFYDVYKDTERKTYDFIVDDGCHDPYETLTTFNAVLPWLNVDGWFIVEDIRLVDESLWQKVSDSMPANYKSFLINMNHLRDMENDPHGLKDNIVFAVKRIS
jgi:hypothetical protein